MDHCKLMVVEGLLTSVGSTNFDNRSFRLDDEAPLNIVDAAFASTQTAACATAHTPAAGGATLACRFLVESLNMRGHPALGSPAPSGVLGVLKSWLGVQSSESWHSSDALPIDPEWPKAHCFGPVRVLVVDDNPVNLMVILALMEARGLVPLLAADGAEAVALAAELQLDLILMDLQMPVLDGLGATTAIRRFEAARSRPAVPVVAYSSACPGAHVLARHGLNGSLSKPCGHQELEDCLVRWCPTYRSAPIARVASHDSRGWQPASRIPDARSASLR